MWPDHTGYIQVVDEDALLATAQRHGLIVRLQYQPGDFVHRGSHLAEIWPAGRCDEDATQRPSE